MQNLIKDQYIEVRSVVYRHGWEQPTEELCLRVRGDVPLSDLIDELDRFLKATYRYDGSLEIVEADDEET